MSKSQLEAALLFQMRAVGLPEPEREFRFDPVRQWRADFCWIEQAIIVEVMGGIWIKGAHSRGKRYDEDCEKQNDAEIAGWLYLRVTSMMIEDGRARAYIERALKEWG